MNARFALLSALLANIALGNLCMMPMAMAAEPDDMAMMGMDHNMASMSHEDDQDDDSNKGMPCDGGHCLTHALPTSTSASVTVQDAVVVLPVALEVVLPPVASETPLPVSTSPPGQYIHVDTIVMRN